MTQRIPDRAASPSEALGRQVRAHDRRLNVLVPRGSDSGPSLLEHLCGTFGQPPVQGASDLPGRGRGRGNGGDDDNPDPGITERNGIWVLTIDGVWRGDFRKLSQAKAAAAKLRSE